jgi:protein-S-isoprenylcysteine O-methyltransferase Ste14
MEDKQRKIYKTVSIVAFVLAVVGLIYLIYTRYLFSENIAVIIVQVAAAGLMIWARFTFRLRSFHASANTTKGKLVTNGPYRFLRHPIYASVIYFVWAGILANLHIDSVAAGFLVSAGLITRMIMEEKFLRVTYDEYKAYSKRAKRLVPFVW